MGAAEPSGQAHTDTRRCRRHRANVPGQTSVGGTDGTDQAAAPASSGDQRDKFYTQLSNAPNTVISDAPKLAPVEADQNALMKPVRKRQSFVSSQPCLICGRRPSNAHRIGFGQPCALGRKVSDEFTVPLCRVHHRDLHRCSDEKAWWEAAKIEPMKIAEKLWRETRD